jgi:transcriptional regulator with XRE-family HTH domain
MSTEYGKKVREALARGGFAKSRVRVKLRPGEMVRLLRQKNELTQADLAARSGLTQSTISSIENGRAQLGVERAKSLARALHVHPAALVFPGWDVDEESAA